MQPVISPWIIYTIHVIDKLNALFCGILSITLILIVMLICVGLFEYSEYAPSSNSKRVEFLEKAGKYLGISLLISTLGVLFIPKHDVMLEMLVLSYITPDNISTVQGNLVDFIKEISNVVMMKD